MKLEFLIKRIFVYNNFKLFQTNLMNYILFILLILFCKEDLKKTEQEKPEAKIEQATKTKTEPVYEYNSYIVKVKSGLKMRKSPYIKSELIQTIPKNAIVFKVEDIKISHYSKGKKGIWVKVAYKLNVGFVFDGYLEKNLSNRNLIDSIFIDDESSLEMAPCPNNVKSEEVFISSNNFTFAPKIGSKINFYPFSKKIKSPIELKVKSVKFEEHDSSGDTSFDKGFLVERENTISGFNVFADNKDNKIYNSFIKTNQDYLKGLVIYPQPKSFSCLNKINLKKEKLPHQIKFLEYAIDLNNDKKPDILKYTLFNAGGFGDKRILYHKNNSGKWVIYQEHSYKSEGTYPVEYLCDEKN